MTLSDIRHGHCPNETCTDPSYGFVPSEAALTAAVHPCTLSHSEREVILAQLRRAANSLEIALRNLAGAGMPVAHCAADDARIALGTGLKLFEAWE